MQMHVIPGNQKNWEAHTKAGFYLGNSWEHYRCHEVWIGDTRSVRFGQTMFFKHKYLTQPAVTESDALLRGADDIVQALKGSEPVKGETRTAIDHLIDMFKKGAKASRTKFDDHRHRVNDAAAMRTVSEENKAKTRGMTTYVRPRT